MALKGTLKDFGIADILQLIGHQQKTGVLTLKQKQDSVAVTFRDGNILKAETTSRNRKELIGSMLVAAELVSEQQLEFALDTQKRTLQRLGDVLVSQGVITEQKFKAMVQLQTSETLFKLFAWKAGTYEFEQRDVEVETPLTPLRAESVLMEGFRRVDEWPVVRKRVTSLQMSFERLKDLPPEELKKDDFDAALDDAFADEKKSVNKGEFQSVGENERKAYHLIAPGRTVQRIIELSALGEFETAKALCNLVNLEYARGIPPVGKGGDDFEGHSRASAVVGVVGRIAVTMVVVGALLFIGMSIDFGAINLGRSNATTYTDPAAQRFASQQQLSRLEAAIDVYKLETGALPISLGDLVEVGLLAADDLHFPWRDSYFYRRGDDGSYVLLPPLR
jgi:hypothetical protein